MKSLAKIFGHNFDGNNFKLFDKTNLIYIEYPTGYWDKYKYNKNNQEIYYENSDGYWEKREHDKNNNQIYYENSNGIIIDNRPITCINKEIIIDGKKYQLVERKE